MAGVVLNFHSKPSYSYIYGPNITQVSCIAPHTRHYILTLEYCTRLGGEKTKQVIIMQAQLNRVIVLTDNRPQGVAREKNAVGRLFGAP